MSFLRHAEGQRHFEHMLATIGGAHLARTGIETAIRAASGPCHTPAGLAAHARRLAVLAAGLDDALTTGVQLHLARGVVDIAIGGTDGSILRRTVTVHGTGFALGARVAARTHMREFDSRQAHAARLNAQHAAIQIGASVGATNGILFGAATMLAIGALRTLAAIAHVLDQGDAIAGAGLLAQLTQIGIDEPISAANGLRAHRQAGRTGTWTIVVGIRAGRTGSVLPTHAQLLLLIQLLLQQILQCRSRCTRRLHQRGRQLWLRILPIVDQERIRRSIRVSIAYHRRLCRQFNDLNG